MAHNSSYSKVWDPAETGSGLAINEVRRCLGSSGRDIASLCTSPRINRWALYKPQVTDNANPYKALTLAERKSANYGFDVSELSGVKVSSVASIFNNAQANGYDWPYKTRVVPFRLSDFSAINQSGEQNGYNTEAQCPFSASSSVQVVSPGYLTRECFYDRSQEIDVEGMGVFTEGQEWEVGMFVKRSGTITFIGTGHYLGVDAFESDNREAIDYNFQLGHTYIIWGAFNSDESSPMYVYFPKSFSDVYVSGIQYIMIVPTIVSPAFKWQGTSEYDVNYLQAVMEAANNDTTQDGSFTLTGRIYQRTSGEDYLLDTKTWSQTIEQGGSITNTLSFDIHELRPEEVALEDLYVEMQYDFYIGSNHYTRNIDLVNKTVVTTALQRYQATQLDIQQTL